MKLGVNILNFGPGGSPDSLRGWARFAEQVAPAVIQRIRDERRGPLEDARRGTIKCRSRDQGTEPP